MDTITQLVTIAAVLLGGLTTYLTNYLTERARYRRSLLTRWDDRRLDAYAMFIDCARTEIHAGVLLYEVRNGLRHDPRREPQLLTSLVKAGRARAQAFERVMLLAGDTVIEAAHEVKEVVAGIEWQARGVVEGDLEMWRRRHVAAFRAINEFHQAARAELGVGGEFEASGHSARGLLLPEGPSSPASEPLGS